MAKRSVPGKTRRIPAAEAVTKGRAAPAHPLDWLFEPLEDHPGYLRRKMFGCEAAYLNGRLMLVLAAGEEPWNGLLVATGRESHPALQAQWKALQPHPVLGKWLYLSQNGAAFDTAATAIVEHVRHGDPRIGVDPRPKKRKRAAPGK
ncbi:MAG: hypothetical protein PHQ12_04820 [Chthoniobacteraceae bacterium]|nr:hypothetical protein [Chthoniobacteraceae bacterium]